MKGKFLAGASLAILAAVGSAPAADAKTIVATIYGVYDARCGVNFDCTLGRSGYSYNTNGGNQYDTPSLFIVNDSSTVSLKGLTFGLTGYQDRNSGDTFSGSIPDIAPHSIYQLTWNGSEVAHDLFGYDYDDEWGNADPGLPECNLAFVICAKVGNFDTLIQGNLNGNPLNPISANFSPDNTQGGGNVAGHFVGWEGLTPDGVSENSNYDDHSTTVSGPLAFIFTGTTGNQHVPEPVTVSLFGAGLGAVAALRRRRKAPKA